MAIHMRRIDELALITLDRPEALKCAELRPVAGF